VLKPRADPHALSARAFTASLRADVCRRPNNLTFVQRPQQSWQPNISPLKRRSDGSDLSANFFASTGLMCAYFIGLTKSKQKYFCAYIKGFFLYFVSEVQFFLFAAKSFHDLSLWRSRSCFSSSLLFFLEKKGKCGVPLSWFH